MKKFNLNRKTVLITAIIFILASGAVFAYWNASRDDFTEETNKQGGAKQSTAEDGTKLKEDGTAISSTAPTANGAGSNKKEPIGVTVTSATQSGDRVIIKTLVDKPGGTCRAVFTKSGQSNVEQSGSVVFVPPSYNACQGLDTLISKFPSGGDWSLVIQVDSSTSSGTSNSVNVGIN